MVVAAVARGRYACRAEADQSLLDFSTGFGVRLDIEGWRDQVNTFTNSDRPAVSPEQRARSGILIEETPHA